jgi:hypothetical protein
MAQGEEEEGPMTFGVTIDETIPLDRTENASGDKSPQVGIELSTKED